MAEPANPPMRTPLPRLVLARVRARGGDADALIRTHGLPDDVEQAPTVVVPVDVLARFYDDASMILDAPDLGLVLATEAPRGAYGLFEFALRAEATLGSALDRLCRSMAVFNRVAQVDAAIEGTHVRCQMTVPGRRDALGRHANEFFIALLVSWARDMVGTPLAIDRVWFCHARPSSVDAHRRVFGCEIDFDASSNGFAFAATGLDIPLREADPALRAAIDERARVELPQAPVPTLLFELRRVLASTTGEVSVRTIARRIGHSPRSLQRHLAALGTTFRQVQDELRRDRARELEREGLPIEAIAERLGYRDLGAFRRAQRRWG